MFSLNHPCGHTCPKTCHNNDDGESLEQHKCQEPCERTCRFGHPCPKKCHEPCPPCVAKVVKTLPCTHSQTVMCCRDPKKECRCSTMVIKEFPICKHQIELPCDWDILNERCQQECGMILDCEHICTAKCHRRTSHDEVDCRQPCRRTACPEKHPCPKKCFQECGPCQYDVIKTLPCSHKMEVKCCVPPKDAYCSTKITRMLDNCEHSVTMDCSASTKGYKCTEPCNRPLCLNNHLCKKLCWEPCGPCYVQVEKQLPCGHFTKMECVRDPLKVRCRVPKEVILQDCGHRAQVDCGVLESDKVYCDYPCEIRLNCGHQCTLKCHMKDDPDHANYRCEKLCGRSKVNCKREHKCNKKCYEECDRCRMKEVRVLPCGHTVLTECGIDDKNVFCERDVMKTIPGCGHLHKFSCSTNVEGKSCNQLCDRQLICGHQCKKTCSDECNEKDCMELMPIFTTSFCGHPIVKICSEVRRDPKANYVTDLMEKIKFLPNCPQSCGSLLACEHSCKGNCGSCFHGRIHKSCEEKCGQILVCGHSCKVNCASSCPPCQERCQYRCEHSRCNKKCGDPCEKCIEPCRWSCKHYKCSQKCSDPCDRPRCDNPCEKRLPCGHSCIGLCGEKCPPLCRVCDGEKLTEFILSGEEEREDSRFVYLQDCGHSIEVEGLDRWMDVKEDKGTNVEIQMKCCPRCKTLIRSNYRYGDTIKRNLSDIERVKELLLDPPSNSRSLMFHLIPNVSRLKAFNMDLKPELNDPSFTRSLDQYLTDLQKKLEPIKTGRRGEPKVPVLYAEQRFFIEVQVDIIETLLDLIQTAPRSAKPATPKPSEQVDDDPSVTHQPPKEVIYMNQPLLADILDRAKRIIISVVTRKRFSVDDHRSYLDEIRRLDLIRAFYLLRSAPKYLKSIPESEDSQLEEGLLKNVNRLSHEDEMKLKQMLETTSNKLNTGLGISDAERQQILQAVGLKRGHWFKCPQGHIYVIGHCGGAMEESICPECGSGIGGQNHRVRSDNQLAMEMDGAVAPAWPQGPPPPPAADPHQVDMGEMMDEEFIEEAILMDQ